MHPLSPGWTSPSQRVPRLDAHVLIQTLAGHVQQAQFRVAHTEAWPSGASWAIEGREADLPFGSVQAWAPVGTPLPALAEPSAPEPPEPSAPAADAPSPPRPPAIAVEVQAEVAATRPVLEAVPDYALDWRPHADLPTLAGAGQRVVALVARIATILDGTEYDVSWPELASDATDRAGLLREFDAAAAAVAPLTEALSVPAIIEPWTLRQEGRAVLTLPRGDVLRRLGLSPLVHHRGQLALYLRTLGVPLAPLYGAWQAPTLDVSPASPGSTRRAGTT